MGILIRAEHALFALLWSFSSESYSYRVILSPCVFRDSKDNFLSTFHSFIRTLQVWNSAKFEPSIQAIYLILCEGGFSLVCRNSAVSSQQSKITNSKGTYVKPSEKCYINIFFFINLQPYIELCTIRNAKYSTLTTKTNYSLCLAKQNLYRGFCCDWWTKTK